MNNDEIRELMSEHLKDLKATAEECEEQFIAAITSSMIETAGFLIQLEGNRD